MWATSPKEKLRRLRLLLAFPLMAMGISSHLDASSSALNPDRLRCEYLKNPLGIDVPKPRLSWELRSLSPTARSQKQLAYQIIVASSQLSLKQNLGDLWDSGKIHSDQSIHVTYGGVPLLSHQVCWWKLRVWDEIGRLSNWSSPSFWTMGLLRPEEWKAQWVGFDGGQEPMEFTEMSRASWIHHPGSNAVAIVPESKTFFRRQFVIPKDKTINRALCGMAGVDSFTLYVNGQEVNFGFDRKIVEFSQWSKIVDLLAFKGNWGQVVEINGLQPGINVLSITLRNPTSASQNPAGLIGALRIEFSNGEPMLLSTNSDWKSSDKEAEGWQDKTFDDSSWVPAKQLGPYGMEPWGEMRSEFRRLPARMLRREFVLDKKIKRATTYVSGLGFYEFYLNGKKVEDHIMDPGLTEYSKRIFYNTYEVAPLLKTGTNAVGIILGNGRFFAPRIRIPVETKSFGYPKLLFEMRIEYEDGSIQQMISDENWKLTTEGPILANNEYDGEEYDARLEQTGWAETGFDDSRWHPVQRVEAPGGVLEPQMMEPIRVTQTIHPSSLKNPKPGIYVLDMGQAFYGVVRLKVSGPAGTRVEMRTSFNLRPDGLLKTENDRSARNKDVYVLSGRGTETWSPRFRGNAYRFVQVSGFPGTPTLDNFEGLVLHTDMEPVGTFACSNHLINQIYSNARWGTRMQNRSTPMDPDRDERQGWSGHPAKTSESEAFVYNVASFYSNWLKSVRLDQHSDGSLQEVSPGYWTFNSRGTIWPAIATIIPNWYYDFYGDSRVLENNYEAMKKWVLYHVKSHQKSDFTIDHRAYGDWVDASTIGRDHASSGHGSTSVPLISTAYHYNNCRLVARAAHLLGKKEDEEFFTNLAQKIQVGFNNRFFDSQENQYESGTQFSYILPLAFGLVPPASRAAVIHNLANDILVTHQGHTTVGLLGMQWMMQVLTQIGHPEIAYTVATQTTRPSWGYMISKGATSIWERWDSDTQGSGMNGESQKILSGNLEAWFFQTLAGINYDPETPGFHHIILRPRPVGDLTLVSASHQSLYGKISSQWKVDGGNFLWDISIPPNTTGTVFVPAKDRLSVTESQGPAKGSKDVKFLRFEDGNSVYEIGSGNYSFHSSNFAQPH
jgi:alpha-L-rhamnosidase